MPARLTTRTLVPTDAATHALVTGGMSVIHCSIAAFVASMPRYAPDLSEGTGLDSLPPFPITIAAKSTIVTNNGEWMTSTQDREDVE